MINKVIPEDVLKEIKKEKKKILIFTGVFLVATLASIAVIRHVIIKPYNIILKYITSIILTSYTLSVGVGCFKLTTMSGKNIKKLKHQPQELALHKKTSQEKELTPKEEKTLEYEPKHLSNNLSNKQIIYKPKRLIKRK